MATNLDVDQAALELLMQLGPFTSKRAAVDAAVREAIAYRRQLKALGFLGTIDFLPALSAPPADPGLVRPPPGARSAADGRAGRGPAAPLAPAGSAGSAGDPDRPGSARSVPAESGDEAPGGRRVAPAGPSRPGRTHADPP
jgi:hypothetical protein